MMALLSPRLWIALALAGVLAFSHLAAYRSGKANVRTQWNDAIATANADARKLEQQRQRRADEASALAGKRVSAIAADAARARVAVGGLRDELSATRLFAAQSSDAAAKSVATLTNVFEQCSKRYSELAEIADRHASDALTLQQSWPK